jgi:hypothetical protein
MSLLIFKLGYLSLLKLNFKSSVFFLSFFLAALGFKLRALCFILARQALYHLSPISSPFCSGYFGHMVSLFAQADRDSNPVSCFLP